jgi:hypothetical protein
MSSLNTRQSPFRSIFSPFCVRRRDVVCISLIPADLTHRTPPHWNQRLLHRLDSGISFKYLHIISVSSPPGMSSEYLYLYIICDHLDDLSYVSASLVILSLLYSRCLLVNLPRRKSIFLCLSDLLLSRKIVLGIAFRRSPSRVFFRSFQVAGYINLPSRLH